MISVDEDFNKQTEQIFSGAYCKNPIIIVMSNKQHYVQFLYSIRDKKMKIEIEDSAGGIPKEVIKRIFESNFTTKTTGKGTGIGLHMSVQIVDKMHGKLDAKNINDGVCFYIVFKSDELMVKLHNHMR